MRLANDSVDENNQSHLWRAYFYRLHPPAGASPSPDSLTVAPGDMLLTYRWLFAKHYAESDPPAYTYLLARLEEAAGDSASAVSDYRAARTRMTRGDERFRRGIDSALTRLTIRSR
jgi:hypothetical protein